MEKTKINELEQLHNLDLSNGEIYGKILLVEDHKMVQMLVKKFLSNSNYDVDAVSDGETALELIYQNHYDLVLMDLKLPNIDGFETAKLIRISKGMNSKVPILALTSSAEYEVREKMFDAGMNDFIGKPFDPKELSRKVELFLH